MAAATSAVIADIKRNALDDGPGIRTVIFFKGCPLACCWCQNPETISPRPQIQHEAAVCLGCLECARRCPSGATTAPAGARRHDAGRCRLCGRCVADCPPAAIRLVGKRVSVEELLAELLRDEVFFRHSGGGVTFSGGEPTIQLAFLARLAAALHDRGANLLLETCGHYDGPLLEHVLLPHLDAVYFDLKLFDPDDHRCWTGRTNDIILANLGRLAALAPDKLLPRVPLVPGITDSERNLRGIADLLRQAGLGRVALLGYNPLWLAKRAGLGMPLAYRHESFMSQADIDRARALFSAAGVEPL